MAVAGPSRLPDVTTGFTIASTLLKKRKVAGTGHREQEGSGGSTSDSKHRQGLSRQHSFAHLDHPSQAVHCLCYEIRLMRVLPCAGSIRTFVHIRRQTIFAHVVGLIVGIEEKEKKAVWLVDDGTAVIAVHYQHNTRPVARSLSTVPPLPPSRKSGIPSKYIRPSTPPPSMKRQACPIEFSDSIAHLDVCNLVSIVGRVDVRFGERILHVDRVMPRSCKAEDDLTYRSEREGHIMLLDDVNQEARHALRAISLAQTEYQAEMKHDKGIEQPLLQTAQQPSLNPRMLLRPLNGWREPVSNGEEQNAQICAAVAAPETTVPKRPRRLRDYRKLSDQHLTEQLLRVYVQKHIHDHCRGDHVPPAFCVSYLMCVRNLFGLAKRIVEYEQEKQRRRRLRSSRANKTMPYKTSQEDPSKKIFRLFESVVRSIMLDGMLVLADRNVPLTAPYDGRKPTTGVLEQVDPDDLLDWNDMVLEQDAAVPQSMQIVGSDLSMIKWRGTDAKADRQEAYQMVTSALLTEPIRGYAISKIPTKRTPPKRLGVTLAMRTRHNVHATSADSQTGMADFLRECDPQHVLDHLRRMDDRWKYLQRDAVLDCVATMVKDYRHDR
jgi:hypothetical protein